MGFKVRVAEPRDAAKVAELAVATMEACGLSHDNGAVLRTHIGKEGGVVSVPFGNGIVVVAEDDELGVVGMALSAPPVRLLQQSTELSKSVRRKIGQSMAEVELLSVAPEAQRRGVGQALLFFLEQQLALAGGMVVLCKVQPRNYPVMRRVNRWGYRFVGASEPVKLRFPFVDVVCDDGQDGFLLAVKPLLAGAKMRAVRPLRGPFYREVDLTGAES